HVKAVRELYPADSGRVTTYYYHSGGIQFIVPLISLKVQGEEKQFDQDGKLIMCCQYVANKRNGFLKTYYSSGQSKRIEMYENDKLQNSKCFTVDGRDTSYYPYMDSLRILNPGQLVTFLNKNVDSLNEVHIKLKFDDTGKPYEINTKLESKDSSKERIINDWVSKNLLWKPLKIDGKTIANETDLDLEIPANIDSLHYNILEKNDYQCSKDYWIVHTNYSSRCWVREMPEFRGGINDLMKYLSANIHYPALCTEKGIKGRVILKFVVEKDGSIDNINVLHSAHPLLDKEAIRVVATMPKWKPGTINGKPVSVFFVLPIVFNL
ncbi:MAG TPA: TonB family protein, partial [Bacteroidales bacterium]